MIREDVWGRTEDVVGCLMPYVNAQGYPKRIAFPLESDVNKYAMNDEPNILSMPPTHTHTPALLVGSHQTLLPPQPGEDDSPLDDEGAEKPAGGGKGEERLSQ